MDRPVGFSLMEVLTSISVLAILGTLAAPSFVTAIQNSKRANAVNSYLHALFLARSEAIKRGTIVSVCKSPDGQRCVNRAPSWSDGWIVFVNHTRDEPPVRDEDEPVLAVYEGWPEGQITSNRAAFSFRPNRQGVVNGTVVFCDSRGSAEARAIIVSHSGRPRISKRDASNRPLRCPGG